MEVILLQKVANLGNIGDKVKVKPGYGRNFLLPPGKAALATTDEPGEVRRASCRAREACGRRAGACAEACGTARELQARADGQGRQRRQAVRLGRHGRHRRGADARPASRSSAAKCAWQAARSVTVGEHNVKLHLHTDVETRSAGRDHAPKSKPQSDAGAVAMEARIAGGRSLVSQRPRARPRPLDADALRIPPHSLEAEQAVLGGLLLDNSTWDAVADRLRAEDFYRRDHQLIFERHRRARRAQRAGDAVTLAEYLAAQGAGRGDRRPRLSRGPGARYADRRQHPRVRRDRARAFAAAAADSRQRRDRRQRLRERRPLGAPSSSTMPNAACSRSPRRGNARAPVSCRCATCSARRSTGSTCCTRRRGSSPASARGYTELDKMTAGLQPGDLVIVAGRPSMGKTTLALNIAEHAAIAATRRRSPSSAWKCRASSSRSA